MKSFYSSHSMVIRVSLRSSYYLVMICSLLGLACEEARKIQLKPSNGSMMELDEMIEQNLDPIDQVLAEEAFATIPTGHTALRRLTLEQIKHALQDVLGSDILVPNVAEPAVVQNGLVAVGASIASFSSRGTNSIEQMAYTVAQQAMDEAHRQQSVTCIPQANRDDQCARDVMTRLGLKLWRRPLQEEELVELIDLVGKASDVLNDFYAGIEFGIARLIQAPHFLFRTEIGQAHASDDEVHYFTSYELASRLSFLLWNTTPDDELLAAAKNDLLQDRVELLAQAERLLTSDRIRVGIRAFFNDFLELRELEELRKDPDTFENYSSKIPQDAREETLKLLEYITVDTSSDIRSMMLSSFSFINPVLATVYQVPAPNPTGFAYVDYPSSNMRSGILTHVSFLALHSHAIDSSATLRGKAVRSTLLCQEIPVPPVDVDTSIPEPSAEQQTLRQRVAHHLTEPSCAGCHALTDPIGLGLENFDALGSWRTLDHGAKVDASGQLDGVDFQHPQDLAQAIAEHPNFLPCLMQKLSAYAIGRPIQSQEEEWLNTLIDRFDTHNYQVRPMLRELIASPLFRTAGHPQ